MVNLDSFFRYYKVALIAGLTGAAVLEADR